jgi:hypothetical protein
MTTPDPTEQLLHAMLERRAEAPVPGWLLSGVSGAVHATGQVAPQGRGGGLAGSRRNRLLLVAAAALLLLSMTAGALLASGVLRLIERPSLHALVTESPSPSPEASVDVTPAPSSAAPDPSPAPARSPAPPAVVAFRPWPMPAGLRYEVGCDEDSGRCFLHLYDEAGGEPKGWPVRLRGDCSSDVAVGPDAAAFVACARNGQAVITGLDLTGSPLPGWPVDVPGQVGYVTWNAFQGYGGAASIAVGPDATVYAAVAPRGRDPGLALHAFAPNGTPRKGWPRHLPGRAQGVRGGIGRRRRRVVVRGRSGRHGALGAPDGLYDDRRRWPHAPGLADRVEGGRVRSAAVG